tara:strand:- start:227 stop:559 length:333 start_codon:yes stop_codon:yes gene_type:complete
MARRYTKDKILNNSSEYYQSIRRGKKAVQHYETPRLHNPSVIERSAVRSSTYIWKYGSRLYNLANQFYGSPRLWWVIAWYNGAPTEAHLKTGDVLYIPLDIDDAYRALGI